MPKRSNPYAVERILTSGTSNKKATRFLALEGHAHHPVTVRRTGLCR